MSEYGCEKEQQLADALRSDSCSLELREHARQCPVCFEVLLVAEFLREEANLAEHEFGILPDAPLIWRKAQVVAREKALVRATLPIRIASIFTVVVAVLAAPWLILESHQSLPWIADLWPRQLTSTNRLWPSGLNETALLIAIAGTIICIGLSSWYMLREE